MLRIPVVVAVAITLLLASCSAPSPDPADPEGSTLPAVSPTSSAEEPPAAESPFAQCDDADRDTLSSLYLGEYHETPTIDYYPDFLPMPSCLFEEPDRTTAIMLDVTETDFEDLEATIVAEQGTGVASDGQGLALAGEEWSEGAVRGMYLIAPGLGVEVQYIAMGFVREG